MTYHKTVQKIIELLKQDNIWFETFEHEPVRTSEEAAKTRIGYSLEQGAKALIVRSKTKDENIFIMLVMPAHLRLDTKKAKQYLQTKDLRFAPAEEIIQITEGAEIGGVPPFGNLFHIPIYVDPKLFENEKIVFNAGDRSFSIAMKSKDYKKLVNPTIIDIT